MTLDEFREQMGWTRAQVCRAMGYARATPLRWSEYEAHLARRKAHQRLMAALLHAKHPTAPDVLGNLVRDVDSWSPRLKGRPRQGAKTEQELRRILGCER